MGGMGVYVQRIIGWAFVKEGGREEDCVLCNFREASSGTTGVAKLPNTRRPWRKESSKGEWK